MEKLLLEPKTKGLVIVAHPDDETIWMGGTLARFFSTDWTILALCRASDSDRAPKFRAVAKHFKADGVILDCDDDGRIGLRKSIDEVYQAIKKLRLGKFDYLFTHGADGEYGHYKHKAVYRAVKRLQKDGVLKTGKTFFFNYKKKNDDKEFSPMVARENTKFSLPLSVEEFSAKQEVMANIYGFDPDGPDTGYCTKVETFK